MVKDTRSNGTLSAPLIKVPNALNALAGLQPVTLTASVTGGGSIVSQPAGLSCGTVCSASFVQGQPVTLTAVPSDTTVLSTWGGAASQCGSAASCTITPSQSVSVQASFVTASWVRPIATVLDNTLTWTNPAEASSTPWFGQNKTLRTGDTTGYAISSDIGDGQAASLQTTVSGPGTLSFFWSVSSESGYDYLEFWINGVKQSGSISGSTGWTQRSFTLPSGSQTLRWVYRKDAGVSSGSDAGFLDRVIFSQTVTPTTYPLQISKTGYRYGSVTSSPGGISCGTSCYSQSASFAAGTSVTLTATPSSGRRFSSWSGACSGTSRTCVVPMSASRTVYATFR
jgi:hypothetical protein